MKKTTFSLAIILAISGFSFAGGDIAPIVPEEKPAAEAPAFLENSAFYLGLGYSYLRSNRTAVLNKPGKPDNGKKVKDTDSSANNILLQAGYIFNNYLAAEGRYTFSAGKHTLTDNLNNGSKENVDIDISNIALYLKPMYPIEDFLFYGLLGYGKINRNHNVRDSSWDGDGFQWGMGLQYTIGSHFRIFADYTQWYDEEGEKHPVAPRLLDTDFSTMNTGVTYSF